MPSTDVARRTEDQVLAESALRGERAVSVVRLGLVVAQVLLFSPVQARVDALTGQFQRLLGIAYALFAVAVFLLLRRVTGNARGARFGPIATNLTDFGVLLAMACASQGHGPPEMARMAIMGALLLCYSVARFHIAQVIQSVGFATVTYLAAAAYLHANVATTVFVVIGYFALGTLIGWTNSRLREIFVEVRKRDQLVRFLPAQVARQALSLNENALAPVQREVTAMFIDIRGFTTLSESMPPGEVMAFLDSFFRPLCDAVQTSGGVVNKFLGDGMLAIWGAPEADAHHAEHAVGAALDIRLRVEQLNCERHAKGLPTVDIGIGIHSGWVAAGLLGSNGLSEYAVIGDAVNVASRVEGLTKVLAVDALLSEATWSRLPPVLRGRRLATKRVKGRTEYVAVYSLDPESLVGAPEEPDVAVALAQSEG